MRTWIFYLLGVISGIILTFVFSFCVNMSKSSGIVGLEMFEEPGDYMEYSQFEVFQVIGDGYALADARDSYDAATVLIEPNEQLQFYDDQKIVLGDDQCAQHVGTYKYRSGIGMKKTVPVVRIVDGVKLPGSGVAGAVKKDSGITLFDKPGDCVSWKNFEVQEVLESGDAIAREIERISSGYVFTSDLEVLILAPEEGSRFYNNQIIKAPKGKCARQIGNYKYEKYGNTKVIPIIAYK